MILGCILKKVHQDLVQGLDNCIGGGRNLGNYWARRDPKFMSFHHPIYETIELILDKAYRGDQDKKLNISEDVLKKILQICTE